MKIVGLITEYNPFHNGHSYHISRAKELTGADYVVVCMSGNFVQRGSCAISDKFTRAQMALNAGADLVVELPVYYAVSSAHNFALGAVALFERMNCIDAIVFGTEDGNLQNIRSLASLLHEEPEEYLTSLKHFLSLGMSYPAARDEAVHLYCRNNRTDISLENQVLTQANQILAIEYCKALLQLNSSITPYAMKRIGDSYHDDIIHSEIASAAALRRIATDGNIQALKSYIPKESLSCLEKAQSHTYPMFDDDFSFPLRFALTGIDVSYPFYDLSEDLRNRIINNQEECISYTQFVSHLKTRNMTYTGVSRSLLHILLNISQDEVNRAVSQDIIYYARVLGLNRQAGQLLHTIDECSSIPLITKLAKAEGMLPPVGAIMLQTDLRASAIFQAAASVKFRKKISNEYSHPISMIH